MGGRAINKEAFAIFHIKKMMQVWTRAIVESRMQVMNSGLGVFRQLHGCVASAITQSPAFRPHAWF